MTTVVAAPTRRFAAVPRDLRRLAGPAIVALVAGSAFVVRFVGGGGLAGLRGDHGYDEGVYVAAGFALVHGRVPYGDLLLLHPPAIVLALAPFGVLARWVGDPDALALARLAWMTLGAVNAVLVARLARPWGRPASLTAGLLYALLPLAAVAESSAMLEPLGTFLLLGAVLLLRRGLRDGDRAGRWLLAGGLVLGTVPTVKIWGFVPAAVVLGWVLCEVGWRRAVRVGGYAAGGLAAVVVPFAVAAGPGRMWRDVVVDQLGRPGVDAWTQVRWEHVLGAELGPWGGTADSRTWALAVVATVLVVAAVLAWRARTGRLWVVMLAAQLAVLVSAPVFFRHYTGFLAAAFCLVVGAGVGAVRLPIARVAGAGAAVGVLVATLGVGGLNLARPFAFPAAQVRAVLPDETCTRTDSPVVLALLDDLSAQLAAGCPLPVDLSGFTFDDGERVALRPDDDAYQRYVTEYLDGSRAIVLARTDGDGFSPATEARLLDGRRAVRLPGVVVLVPTH